MGYPAPTDPEAAFLATLTVLYVEDEAVTRWHLAEFLRRRVGRLLEATNGDEGLQCFRADRPALVITDIRMPGMDGLSMVEEIRRLDTTVPVIVTTAFEQIDYLERSIDVGVDRYVTKPVDICRLEAAILNCVRRLRAEAALVGERHRELERLRAHEREALGMLAGGLAHDFNNLLQVILGNLYLALENNVGDQRELLADALDSAQEASLLSLRLLTLAEHSREPFRLGPIEPTLRTALAAALSGRGTSLRLDLSLELPAVLHDAELLGRAFSNLAQNACEAMKDGGVLAVAGSERRLAEREVLHLPAGRYVQLTFRDTGPGIASEILPRIFDPYFTTRVGGTGIGLFLSRQIIERSFDGRLEVRNVEGGAEFTVLTPLR